MRTLKFSAGFIIGMIITVACFVMSAHVKAPTALVDEQPVLVAPSNASTTSYDDHCAGLRELTADADAYLPSIPQLRIRSYHDTDVCSFTSKYFRTFTLIHVIGLRSSQLS